MINKNKFESLSNPMFKKLSKSSMVGLRGGYTICKTGCDSTLWGGDTYCSDSSRDEDPKK
jgi:hypothetical protein